MGEHRTSEVELDKLEWKGSKGRKWVARCVVKLDLKYFEVLLALLGFATEKGKVKLEIKLIAAGGEYGKKVVYNPTVLFGFRTFKVQGTCVT